MKGQISRRDFVRDAGLTMGMVAAGALAAGAGSALAAGSASASASGSASGAASSAASASASASGSASAQSTEGSTGWMPAAWDYEADIIAIGAGGAGLAAAVEACDQGLSIIVLESQGIVGGDSAICNGGMAIPGSPLQKQMGIEDSVDKMYEDITTWVANDYDAAFIKKLCELNATYLYDWLTGMGLEFKEEGLIASNSHSVPREHHIKGYDVIQTLYQNATDKGADVQLEVEATHLIQNPDTKRVIGVEATKVEDGSIVYYKASKAVLLCSGGYSRNVDMLNHYVFGGEADKYMNYVYDSMGQDGSGILMAMELGADTRHMDYLSMLTTQNPDGDLAVAAQAIYQVGGVLVNMEGERFVNEAQGYTNVWSELNQQTDQVCYTVWDQAIYDEYKDNASSYYNMENLEKTGLLLKADTYADLADLMGVPADAFQTTMDTYNSDLETTGTDSVMGRAHTNSDGPAAMPLDTAPFYAYKTTNVICCTYGGIKLDEETSSLAVDVFGNVIPSLYIAGNISNFSNMGCKPGTRIAKNASGCAFGGAISFGRYCVQEIADLDSWDA